MNAATAGHSQKSDLASEFARIRADFPILNKLVHKKPLVYLDNAATSQKPRVVIDAISDYYLGQNSNVHRGVHQLSQDATNAFENARETAQRHLNAAESAEVIFVRGTTEGINLVAYAFTRPKLEPGDEILISALEHHSNIVPWQLICKERGASLRVIPMNERGELDLSSLDSLITARTKLVAVTHVSNALGTLVPIETIIERAHARGVPVLIDGAQAVPHTKVDVRALDCDFYVYSGHKIFAPTGIGVLYGKRSLLEAMPPWQGGGDMIASVTFEKTTYNSLPYKFEAGTPDIAGAIGLGAALTYIHRIGIEKIAAWEAELLGYGTELLTKMPGIRVVGTAAKKASVISFIVEGIHAHDVGTILDREGIAVRAGHHCAQPVMDAFCIPATARASLAFYNSKEDLDALARGLHRVQEIFA